MELSEIDVHIKSFIHQIYKYDEQIYKLTSYHEGILTFTQLTPSPLNSMIVELSIHDDKLKKFIWLVPYNRR